MRDSDPADETWTFDRRTTLKLTAGLAAGGTFLGSVAARGSDAGEDGAAYYAVQGDREIPVEPLTGDVPVEELYELRIPEKYESVGTTDPGEGPYYSSLGTESLQRNATTTTFLYDGPNGLSFVVVHDAVGGDGGGSATWEITGVPKNVDWLVMDDYYVNPDTGEQASTNYDTWNTDGTGHRVDWTWGAQSTDGGVLGYLGEEFSLTVHPAFNESAELYGEHYSGQVENWTVLSGGSDGPERISLDRDAAVTVASAAARESGETGGENATETRTTARPAETPRDGGTRLEDESAATRTTARPDGRTEASDESDATDTPDGVDVDVDDGC